MAVATPDVSVIIPCYNGGRFLPNALASLAAQTFRNFETIVVDDGSTDAQTRTVLDGLGPDVNVIRQENRGLPAARNTGIRAARAAFVLPFDCDDLVKPTLLEETVPVLRTSAPDVAFVTFYEQLSGARSGIVTVEFDPFAQLFHNRLHYCLLLRKSAWQAVGGYDETMRSGYEDWEFNVHLIAAGFRGVVVPKPLFVYSVSADGMLMSRSGRMHATLWRSIRDRHPELYRWSWLRAHNGKTNSLRRLLRYASAYGFLMTYGAAPESLVNRAHYCWLSAKRRGLVPWQVTIN
jgi:glycosyltransferase involved in cell wall biosynthesis